jgi:hypothetical protein
MNAQLLTLLISVNIVSQAKYREMQFQHAISQLQKQHKFLLNENQLLRTRPESNNSEQPIVSMNSNVSYMSKESPPLTPESTLSGNNEIDADGSLDSINVDPSSLCDELERSMDESTSEDMAFVVPVCNPPPLSGSLPLATSSDNLTSSLNVPSLFRLSCLPSNVLDKLFEFAHTTAHYT